MMLILNLNWYESLKEKVGATRNGFMYVLIASSAILVITMIAALVIDRKRHRRKKQEHELLQNQSSPTKGIVASMSMLLLMGDARTSSEDDDVVSSYNGSVSEILFDTSPYGNGRPSGVTICTCNEGSTLQSKEQYGDRVVAVNDKDVQYDSNTSY